MAARTMMSRLVLRDADHARSTGDICACAFRASDDAGAFRECVTMARSVVPVRLSMRLRKSGRAEAHDGVRCPIHTTCLKEYLPETISTGTFLVFLRDNVRQDSSYLARTVAFSLS
jgi:hypothetical protein